MDNPDKSVYAGMMHTIAISLHDAGLFGALHTRLSFRKKIVELDIVLSLIALNSKLTRDERNPKNFHFPPERILEKLSFELFMSEPTSKRVGVGRKVDAIGLKSRIKNKRDTYYLLLAFSASRACSN